MIFLPNGIGESTGDILATCKPLYVHGDVYWVNSETGDDAATAGGQDRMSPLATLGQAVTNASEGDIIVLAAEHDETLTAAIGIDYDVTIIGAGSSGGRPTAKLTNNQSDSEIIAIESGEAACVQIRNIYFVTNMQSSTVGRIRLEGTGVVRVSGCYFECGECDDGPAVDISTVTSGVVISERNTYISIATTVATRPYGAIGNMDAYGAPPLVILDSDIYDNGTVGWSESKPVNLDQAVQVWAHNITCLRGASIEVGTAYGYLNVQSGTGGVRTYGG